MAFTPLNLAVPTARKRYLIGFTLIELLVTMTIIVLMAVVAIPNFNKHQVFVELQNKSDEVKAGIEGMQVKALNAEQGKTRYYAQIYTTGKVEYGSVGTDGGVYKAIDLITGQALAPAGSVSDYLVCDKGKNYCCNVASSDATCTTAMNANFFTIASGGKTTTFNIFSNPFRVTTTTN